jgi:hypothetical protein
LAAVLAVSPQTALVDELHDDLANRSTAGRPVDFTPSRTIRKLDFGLLAVAAWLAMGISAGRKAFISNNPGFEAHPQRQNYCKWRVGSANSGYFFIPSFDKIGVVYRLKYKIKLIIYLMEF